MQKTLVIFVVKIQCLRHCFVINSSLIISVPESFHVLRLLISKPVFWLVAYFLFEICFVVHTALA